MAAIRGFLAMEYYWLFLNRSFVVFTYPDGLYGWKFSGPVSSLTPRFFVPLEEVTKDAALVPGSTDFEEFMKQRGSFYVPRGQIASVDFDPSPRWGGMGPVPHSGKIYVRLNTGKSRGFILLGSQNGEAVRSAVWSGTPISVF